MDFHSDWAGREVRTMAVDLWIAYPYKKGTFRKNSMLSCLQEYCDKAGLCVTVTETWFVYTGGREPGWKIGLRNYPRFPCSDSMDLLVHAEKIGKAMAHQGRQGSFMIEEHGGATYWLTRRLHDGASPQTMAECDCETPETCGRTGCEF